MSGASLHDDLRFEVERLRTLVEASKLINSSLDDEGLFESILSVARGELGVERGTLYFVDLEKGEIWSKIASGLGSFEIRLPIGKGLAGAVAATGEPIVLHDAYSDPRFDRSSDARSGFHTRSMLCVPINNRQGKIVGVLQLLNKIEGDFGKADLDFLESLSDHMAIAMENSLLHLSEIEKNRMEQELQLGREIQARLLPTPPCDVNRTTIAASSISCYEVGGDYYDFIELPSGHLGVALGDVSGKGVAAAMIMSSVQAALRMAAPIEPDMPQLMRRLNSLLFRSAGGRKYVTFFYANYDPLSGHMAYVNAGHNPGFLLHDGQLTSLDSTGVPIGLMPEARYTEGAIDVPAGATLFLYTDGMNEATNETDEELGMDRWKDLMLQHGETPVEEIPQALVRAVEGFEGGAPAYDDKTIVVLRRT